MNQYEFDFEDKHVLINGAAGHLGQKLAQSLVALGANLILLDKNEAGLSVLKNSLPKSKFNTAEFIVCDLEIDHERKKYFSEIRNKYSKLHGIVNCSAFVGDAELTGWKVDFEEQSIQTWRRVIEVNLTSIFEICQILAPLLKVTTNSSIVNVSSIYSEKGPKWEIYEGTNLGNPAAYSVSKGGLNQLTRWLATTLAPKVRVNAVAAGGVQRNQPTIFLERYSAGVPLSRMASEKDLVGPILFLLSDMSSYITGEVLHVDGGRGIW
jgi:NAD(P)-dependent dehydrogenase (short-subunit alcohol dehydrogenase family)